MVNLGDHESIVSSGSLISKIHEDERFGSVSLLIFEKYRSSALVLNNVEEIITIDGNSIQTLFNNKIYPKYFSLNLFMDKMNYIKNSHFGLLVNYSGDKTANYISGYFSHEVDVCGSYYSSKNILHHTDDWSMVNDIREETGCFSFDRNDIYRNMMGLNFGESDAGYVVREKHEKTVVHSLNKLRSLNRREGGEPKIVGVTVGSESQAIPVKFFVDLLREIRIQKEFLPLVISGTSDEDEHTAKMINERLGHSLALVKMDIVAAPSLIKGLDALICSDAPFKCLSDLVGTQIIHLSFKNESAWAGRSGSIVATLLCNDGKGNPVDKSKESKRSSDVVKILEYVLCGDDSDKLRMCSDISVYKKKGEGEESFYEKINEGKEGEYSINRVMTRNVVMLRFYNPPEFDKKFHYLLSHNSGECLSRWINSERRLISRVMKEILSVIRLVLQSQKDKAKTRELACKLDSLFSYEKMDSPIRIPVIFLRGLIFSVDKVGFVLEELYKTKNHLKKIQSCRGRIGQLAKKRAGGAKIGKNVGAMNG